MKYPPCLSWPQTLVVCLLVFLLPVLSIGQEERIFTNKDGVEIEAVLLQVIDGTQVQIRRKSDGRNFTLPISSLSLEDQQYLSVFLRKQQARSATSAKSIVVSVPNLRDRVFPVSDRSTWDNSAIGASTYRFTLPSGTWVCYNPEGIYGRFLIPYLGEETWEIHLGENGTVWLSRDGGERELVGVSLERNGNPDNQDRILSLDQGRVTNVLTVACEDIAYLDLVERIPDKLPLAVMADEYVTDSVIQDLSRRNLIALYGRADASLLPELERLESLKFLGIEVESIGEDEIVELPDIPGLEHLALLDGATHVNWDETLATLPNLRSLTTIRTRTAAGSPGTPITTFESNPYLNFLALHHRDGEYLQTGALKTAPDLVYLKIEEKDVKNPYEDLSPLFELKRLRYLFCALPDFPLEDFDQWCESGALEDLGELATYQIPLVEKLPSLESLALYRSESSGSLRDYTRVNSLPESVRKLRIYWLPISNARSIEFSHPDSIECLQLVSTTLPDSNFLYQFRNLRYLSFSSDNGNVPEIDLSEFPELEYANFSGVQKLTALKNLATHPAMKRLIVRGVERLWSLGEAANNESLADLTLSNLPYLENLDSLSRVQGLRYLYLDKCDALTSYDTILEKNDLIRLSVRNCAKLTDTSEVPQKGKSG